MVKHAQPAKKQPHSPKTSENHPVSTEHEEAISPKDPVEEAVLQVQNENPITPVSPVEAAPSLTSASSRKVKLFVPLAVILLVILGGGGYYFYQHQNASQSSEQKAVADVQDLVTKVGRLIILPSGEAPTTATVTDVGKLSGQPFFANAQNGDKVLIYTKSKKAYLYRPQDNKLVEVGPVNITDAQAQAAASPKPQVAGASIAPSPTLTSTPPVGPVKVAIFNGTETTGLTKKAEQVLTGDNIQSTILARGNALKQDYTQTIVVDLIGSASQQAEAIAQALHGSVASLPKGENTPDGAQVLIILGRDFSDSQVPPATITP